MKTLRRHWDLAVAVAAAGILSACSPLVALYLLSDDGAAGAPGMSAQQVTPISPDAGSTAIQDDSPRWAEGGATGNSRSQQSTDASSPVPTMRDRVTHICGSVSDR